MTPTPITGFKESPLSKGATGGRALFENDSTSDIYDMRIHVNDDSWNTPEFKKIKIRKLAENDGELQWVVVSVLGGDLSESEHVRFQDRPIERGEIFKIEFDLNDKIGDKGHVAFTPTDEEERDILNGDDAHEHEDISIWDKIWDLISILGKLASFANSARSVAGVAAEDRSATGQFAVSSGLTELAKSVGSMKLDRRSARDLEGIETEAQELLTRALKVVERAIHQHADRVGSSTKKSKPRSRTKEGK